MGTADDLLLRVAAELESFRVTSFTWCHRSGLITLWELTGLRRDRSLSPADEAARNAAGRETHAGVISLRGGDLRLLALEALGGGPQRQCLGPCGRWLLLDHFSADADDPEGRFYRCRCCERDRLRQYRVEGRTRERWQGANCVRCGADFSEVPLATGRRGHWCRKCEAARVREYRLKGPKRDREGN